MKQHSFHSLFEESLRKAQALLLPETRVVCVWLRSGSEDDTDVDLVPNLHREGGTDAARRACASAITCRMR